MFKGFMGRGGKGQRDRQPEARPDVSPVTRDEPSYRKVGQFEGWRVFSDPVYLNYTAANNKMTVGFETTQDPPSKGEMVLVLFTGANLPMLVELAETRDDEMLFLTGIRIKTSG